MTSRVNLGKNMLPRNIKKLIETIKARGTTDAEAVAKIFELNRGQFESALTENLSACLADVIQVLLDNCYAKLPNPDALDQTIKYFKDSNKDIAGSLQQNYWELQDYLIRLRRTDITDDERLYSFLQVDRTYNACLSAIARLNALEARKPLERPYDIF